MREYDLIADWYGAARVGATGVPEVTRVASSIPSGARVLDIGCGNGLPITRALLGAGHQVVGLDSSSEMLVRFRGNCPEALAVQGLVQSCPFAGGLFDAAVAWGVRFHLNGDDEARAIASVSRILRPGALFLFTSGDVEDSVEGIEGTMNGVAFRYFSFGVDSYRRILGAHALTLLDVHADAGNNTYHLARKSS